MPPNKTGFAAARRHALETYGPEAVKTGDKCFTKQTGRGTSSYVPTALGVEHARGRNSGMSFVSLKGDAAHCGEFCEAAATVTA